MVKLSEYLSIDIISDLDSVNKMDAIREMIALISHSDKMKDPKEYEEALYERERILSTGIGLGVAVPHAKVASVDNFIIALGRSRKGIDYESIDDKPVHLIFMIAGPECKQKEYLKILAKISLIARNEDTKAKIMSVQSDDEIYELLQQF